MTKGFSHNKEYKMARKDGTLVDVGINSTWLKDRDGNILRLIKDIKNICRENHSILLLSVNPKMFEKKRLSILEKEFLEVK